ncbi:hypothetical protein LAZ67_4002540 [Cordylochernes scorpioides]|uniref:Uncharacterized protein n=1 Tax=Cordylochernes scorpioides TaxID=51811 RepID=A0ABY6KCW0_9ARAC|nr:hypothetical protein LAZ67_4002540 [Cordylochernes scorpioides]
MLMLGKIEGRPAISWLEGVKKATRRQWVFIQYNCPICRTPKIPTDSNSAILLQNWHYGCCPVGVIKRL